MKLANYVATLPSGSLVTANQMAAQLENGKPGRKLQLTLRQLVADGMLSHVAVATYKVA